ncbi:glycerate kinase, partial [Rhizobium ruizarguesonis]
TRHDAIAIIEQYGLKLPPACVAHLHSKAADAPRPDDTIFASHHHHIVASAAVSMDAAAATEGHQGIDAVILSDSIEGEARD